MKRGSSVEFKCKKEFCVAEKTNLFISSVTSSCMPCVHCKIALNKFYYPHAHAAKPVIYRGIVYSRYFRRHICSCVAGFTLIHFKNFGSAAFIKSVNGVCDDARQQLKRRPSKRVIIIGYRQRPAPMHAAVGVAVDMRMTWHCDCSCCMLRAGF